MSALTFMLRAPPDQRLDLSPLTPGNLVGKSLAEIAVLELQTTRTRVTTGEVFKIRMAEPATIRFIGGSERFDWLGHAMQGGAIEVEGEVGAQCGRLMAGGSIVVHGRAGCFAASGLTGGRLEIKGAAGDCLGAPAAGEMAGMAGGLVIVRGAAGQRAGERLRRGVMIVEGDAGAYAGCRMVAGTLIVCGKAARHPGVLMQRGTILLSGASTEMSPAFVDCGLQDLVIARLLASAVANDCRRAAALFRRPLRRLAGDMSQLGKGEILLPA